MWLEYLRIARKVLRAHRFRSFLTMLSITIGAFSIVLMSSLAESGLATLTHGLEDLGGARLMMIEPKQPERAERKQASYSDGITRADLTLLLETMPHLSGKTVYQSLWRRDVAADTGGTARTDVVAGDGGFLQLFKMRIVRGRGFTEEENQQAKVCVVGHKLAQKLFEGDAIGHWMRVQGTRCHVIGQLANEERWGIGMGFDWLDVVVIPMETLGGIDPTLAKGRGLLVKTDDQRSNEIVKRIANALLVERHHGVDDFEIFDFSGFMNKFNQTFSVMEMIVGFIAGIALLVGGVGVMNMMLVSVSERVREIGVRKALGASPRDIGAQFLCEAIVLSGFGGVLGVAGGIGAAMASAPLIHHFTPSWIGLVAHKAVITSLSVSIGIGVLFGYFPARRASKLDAITAMRR